MEEVAEDGALNAVDEGDEVGLGHSGKELLEGDGPVRVSVQKAEEGRADSGHVAPEDGVLLSPHHQRQLVEVET